MNPEDLTLAYQLIPLQLWNTIYMVAASTFFAVLIGLPLGVILTITDKGHIAEQPYIYKTLETIVNITRSFPFAILMVALIPVTRAIVGTSLGTTASIVPLSIAAAPFIARLVESSLKEVDRYILEAAVVMGSNTWQIITKVLIPEALPAIVSAITLTVVNLIGYSAMAGLVGGGGLGQVAIQYGYNRFNSFIMFTTVILLIILVQGVQWMGSSISRLILRQRGIVLTLLVSLGLFSCSSESGKTLKVAATPVPHAEMLEIAKIELKEKGINLTIIVMDDYNIPNRALANREVDANFFQHKPYLDEQIHSFKYPIHSIAKIEIEPMGIYSQKIKTMNDLKDNATIAIPNDPSNEARALHILHQQGLIELDDPQKLLVTLQNIKTNQKNLKFIEIDAAMLPRTLDDVDIAAINTNFAIAANLTPIVNESTDSPYANILVIHDGDDEREDIQALKAAMTSEKMKEFIQKKYKGRILPAF